MRVHALAIARRDLLRERRAGEVLWVTIPFAAVALLLIPLAIGTDQPTLERIGLGLFWVVVLLFGVLIAIRRSAAETPEQRDLTALLGLDPAAEFIGQAAASALLLLGFEVVVGAIAVVLYNIELALWFWIFIVMFSAGVGLALLGTLASVIARSVNAGPTLVPFLVAPLAVPILLAATQALNPSESTRSILSWVLLMLITDLVLVIGGMLSARSLQETR